MPNSPHTPSSYALARRSVQSSNCNDHPAQRPKSHTLCKSAWLWGLALTAGVLVASCTSTGQRTMLMPEDFDAKFATGAILYHQNCAACHGLTGQGDGRASSTFKIQPRQFRHESFRYVSTGSAGAPAQEDLERTIRFGMHGTVMPTGLKFSDDQVRHLANYIREIRRLGIVEQLSQQAAAVKDAPDDGDDDYGDDAYGDDDDDDNSEALTPQQIQEIATNQMTPGPVLTVAPRRPGFQSNLVIGRKLFLDNCAKCHGNNGRGDGPEDLKDELGRPIRPRNLALGVLRGGNHDRDLYFRIRSGLPGTPMPGFSHFSDDEVYHLIDYVQSLSRGGG